MKWANTILTAFPQSLHYFTVTHAWYALTFQRPPLTIGSSFSTPANCHNPIHDLSSAFCADGHLLPVCTPYSDGLITKDDEEPEAIVVLLQRHRKQSLHRKYLDSQAKLEEHVAFSSFIDVLHIDIFHFRFSLRAGGLYDICSVLCGIVCTVTDSRLPRKAMEWRKHLYAAEITLAVYQDSVESGNCIDEVPGGGRLALALVFHDYAL